MAEAVSITDFARPSERRRRGRPTDGPTGRSKTFTTRITPMLHEALEKAAAERGVSVATEVNLRLEKSFGTRLEFEIADNGFVLVQRRPEGARTFVAVSPEDLHFILAKISGER